MSDCEADRLNVKILQIVLYQQYSTVENCVENVDNYLQNLLIEILCNQSKPV